MGESRTELLAWINDLCHLNYTKIEQAGTGRRFFFSRNRILLFFFFFSSRSRDYFMMKNKK